MTDNSLLNNVPAGAKITVETPDGRKKVYVKATKQQIIKRKYSALIGNPITVTEAADKYDVHRDTIIEWKKNKYISVLKPGYRMELDEADTAYCAGLYHERKKNGIGFGTPLLDNDGLPYQLKHPRLSKYRLKKQKQIA